MPDPVMPSVRPAAPKPNEHGYTSNYVTPSGHLEGLRGRLARWVERMGTDRSLPWVGLGLVRDLEVVMRLLNLREFAEWLKLHGPPEHQEFADDILRDQETIEAVHDALKHAGHEVIDPVAGVEALDGEVRQVDAIRQVLVETGALAADDQDTPIPDLLRALLA